MMSYVIDGVLLLALLLTSLRVGMMYRELKRLRLYQSQYLEVFGETSRAADHIGEAVRNLGTEAATSSNVLARASRTAGSLQAARSRDASLERCRDLGRVRFVFAPRPCERRRNRGGLTQVQE
jgi:hypothetical protein